ncbi:MAG: flagellar M-ring protein FliF [Candidatus Margulisbacteria bacterium GWF2_35_9]|nr:MAG: flagellar M-ring protein FliF [Candidatus Margulisbacteria bacterium GWF2_35_9]
MVEETSNEAVNNQQQNQPMIQSIISRLMTDRIVQIGVGVAVVFIIVLIIVGFLIRGGKSSEDKQQNVSKNYKYIDVFTQLTGMDAAQMRESLSFENIPFKSVKNGRIVDISIPKQFADQARIKMAQLGLPEGGIVGFEIFDKSQSLGATEYDRRIQYVRAVSGELSRVISHMENIASSRVQIVMPEKKIFGETIPGSASVALNVKPKKILSEKQIRGIMHLVASSVQDLSPQDVTVINNDGIILSDKIKTSIVDKKSSQVFDMLVTQDDETKSPLEMLLTFKNQLKDKYEVEITDKTKQVLDTLYPLGSFLVFTNVSLVESQNESSPYIVNKIDIAILLDSNNRNIKLTSQLKASTYSLVASTTGYIKGRDRIVLEQVPFVNIDSDHAKNVFSSGERDGKPVEKKNQISMMFKFIYSFVLITMVFIFLIFRFLNTGKKSEEFDDYDQSLEEDVDIENESNVDEDFSIEKFRAFLKNNEDLVVNQLIEWLE